MIVVHSDHFVRYKCKITHGLDSQTLSEYISMIVLDFNEKVSINEVLEVLIGVGTFISTSTLQFQIIAPPPHSIFGFFVTPTFLIWTPLLISFPGFVLQKFQRLIKRIVLFVKL